MPSLALAQVWPARPITVIVPFAAGGTTDIIARVVGDLLGQKLGQTFIVENRGGAGGAIGSDAVVRAAPDGYSLLHATAGTLTYNPHIVQHARLRRADVDAGEKILSGCPPFDQLSYLGIGFRKTTQHVTSEFRVEVDQMDPRFRDLLP